MPIDKFGYSAFWFCMAEHFVVTVDPLGLQTQNVSCQMYEVLKVEYNISHGLITFRLDSCIWPRIELLTDVFK